MSSKVLGLDIVIIQAMRGRIGRAGLDIFRMAVIPLLWHHCSYDHGRTGPCSIVYVGIVLPNPSRLGPAYPQVC